MAAVIERAELHKTIWRIANDLRGSVDGWDFKSYVLGFLFYRFISENLTDYVNATEREAILAEVEPLKRPRPSITRPSVTRTLRLCATVS